MGNEEEDQKKKKKTKKKENGEKKRKEENEGYKLLGLPTFTELENGRLKCVETGHELLPADKDCYSQSKRCRLGLINFSISKHRPLLNMFKQDPLNRSRLICKLTGDTVNKSEEHIWKHLNGKRFLNKLEQMETGKLDANGEVTRKAEEEENGDQKKKTKNKKKKKKKDKKGKEKEEIISEVQDSADKDNNSEEGDFWVPPSGDRWDFDDGGDRWESGEESGQENNEENDAVEDASKESEELSNRKKRMSTKIGPDRFASRKKKSKKNPTS